MSSACVKRELGNGVDTDLLLMYIITPCWAAVHLSGHEQEGKYTNVLAQREKETLLHASYILYSSTRLAKLVVSLRIWKDGYIKKFNT